MEKKFKNKIFTINNAVELVDIIEDYYQEQREEQFKEEQKEKNAREKGDFYIAKNVNVNINYSITFNNNETISEKDSADWFKETLKKSTKDIKSFEINLYSYKDDKRESINLYFTQKSIYLNSSSFNLGKNDLARQIESYIDNLPPRYDILVQKDNIRKIIPSLSISMVLGILLSAIFYTLCKLDILPFELPSEIYYSIIAVGILVLISFIGALLIPTKNHTLYKQFKFEKIYAGMDSDFKSVYKNDYNQFKNECEICIGDYSKMPEIRKQIAQNYKKSKKIVYVELFIAIIAIVLFFVV